MRIYLKNNVYEEALERTRYVFEEFDGNVAVSFSGGKDSTVILELALIVARERGELPLKVYWLDQESEWTKTVEYCKRVFYNPEIDPYWFQVPFKLSNASSFYDKYLKVWDEELDDETWLHSKDPISIKENDTGTDRFGELLKRLQDKIFSDIGVTDYAVIYGLKANESLARRTTLTYGAGYKDTTWSAKASSTSNPEMRGWKFAPIYDWNDDDNWIAINKFGWDYNEVYNDMFRWGDTPRNMRVSSLIHETSAEYDLSRAQELDPKLYERLTQRIDGVSTYSRMDSDVRVKHLPTAFASWEEYRRYLVEKLVEPENRKLFDSMERSKIYREHDDKEFIEQKLCNIVLSGDIDGTKFGNLSDSLNIAKKHKQGRFINDKLTPLDKDGNEIEYD